MIDTAKCADLFCLFAMLSEVGEYQPLLEAAIAECERMLRDGADRSDVRLCYFCAALANLRYTQMMAARYELSHTYAGTVAKSHDATVPCGFAERLVHEYRAAATDLLIDCRFLFTGIA